MTLRYPKTLDNYDYYKKKRGLVVVKFGAEWCGPCKRVKPLMKELAGEFKSTYFVDVDIDSPLGNHKDCDNVRTIPHFKFFIDGELKREIIGTNTNKLKEYVKRYSK